MTNLRDKRLFLLDMDGTLYIGDRLFDGVPEFLRHVRSMGDFVVTGGEIPAMALADCLCRMVPGVLPEESCYTDESHWNGLLEYPQYSRPEEWHGRSVPEVLLSGHHGNVADWRTRESYKRTMARRPDLWEKFDLTQVHSRHDKKVLAQALAEYEAEQPPAEPDAAAEQAEKTE